MHIFEEVFLILIVLVCTGLMGFVGGICHADSLLKAEATSVGVAEYRVDARSGKTQFFWLNGTNAIPERDK